MSSNAISFSRNDYMIQVISLANLQSFNPKFSTWDKADAVVLSWLLNAMTLEVSDAYMFMKTTKEVWDSYKANYSKVGDAAQIWD